MGLKTAPLFLILTIVAPQGSAGSPGETQVRWASLSLDAWSGAAISRTSGGLLQVAGASDSAVESTNPSAADIFMGLLPPLGNTGPEPSTPTPTPDESPSATPSPGGPTETPTPTPTSTSCLEGLVVDDFNLDGIEGIDARDLLLLQAALSEAEGNPYDFNCDGKTDLLDLLEFTGYWQFEGP